MTTISDLEPTATHLPVWEYLARWFPIQKVLEFGCGRFSTAEFARRGWGATSIEMQSPEWCDRMRGELPEADIRLALGPYAWRDQALLPKYDLVFVDGHGDSRPDCLMWAKDRSDVIVAHDTDHPYYRWERADMRGFDRFVFCTESPTTTIWIRR